MSQAIEGARIEKPRINSIEALTAIFSHLPTDQLYTADSSRWTQSMLWLRDRYEGSHPEILEDLSFSQSGGYSREVSQFLTLLQWASLVETRRLEKTRLLIREEAVSGVRLTERLDPAAREVVGQMAQDLVEYKGDLLFAPY